MDKQAIPVSARTEHHLLSLDFYTFLLVAFPVPVDIEPDIAIFYDAHPTYSLALVCCLDFHHTYYGMSKEAGCFTEKLKYLKNLVLGNYTYERLNII